MELRPHHSPDDNRQRPESSTTTTAPKASRADATARDPDEVVEAVLAQARHQLLDQSAPPASADVGRWFAVGGPRAERAKLELCEPAPSRRHRSLWAVRVACGAAVAAVAAAVVLGGLSVGPGARVVTTPSSAPTGLVEVPSSDRAPLALPDGTLILSGPAGGRPADVGGTGTAEVPASAGVTDDQPDAPPVPAATASAAGAAASAATPKRSATSGQPVSGPSNGNDGTAGSSDGAAPAPPAVADETRPPADVKVQIDYWFAVHRYDLCLKRRAVATPEAARPCGPAMPVPAVLRSYVAALARRDACIARWEPVVGAVRAQNRCGAAPDAVQFGVIADPFGPRRSALGATTP